MQTTVTMGAASPPDWRARGEERIRQNVRNLLSLVRYELPYARTLGLPAGLIDLPARGGGDPLRGTGGGADPARGAAGADFVGAAGQSGGIRTDPVGGDDAD